MSRPPISFVEAGEESQNFSFAGASEPAVMRTAVGDALEDERQTTASSRVADALKEHGPVLARVCMALVGDRDVATRALEQVARDAATRPMPEDAKVFLLGLARSACAVQSSRMPMRTQRLGLEPDAPRTERLGGDEPAKARTELARLRPTEREAVVLHAIGGLDVRRIAAACGIEEGAARARLARGLLQLADGSKTESGEGGRR